MKLILPIAGVGLRLRPFTYSKPKGFLKIGGKRIVDHILEKIGQELHQPMPLAVISGYMSQQIRAYFDEHYGKRYSIGHIDQQPIGYEGDIPYFGGLGQAVLLTRNWYDSTEAPTDEKFEGNDTLIFLGDMIPADDYSIIMKLLVEPDVDGVIGTMIVPEERTKFYGIVGADSDSRIISMVEKPEKTEYNQAIAGIYALKAKTMARLYQILEQQYSSFIQNGGHSNPGKSREFQFTPALQQLVTEGFHIKSAVFTGGILDFGRPDALLEGNRILLSGSSNHIETRDNITYSSILPQCSISPTSSINRSIIGPYVSIGSHCTLDNCILHDVVIGDHVNMKNIITSQSIIGDYVTIEQLIKDRMILGDHSFIIETK